MFFRISPWLGSAVLHTAAFAVVMGGGGRLPSSDRHPILVPLELVDVEDDRIPPPHPLEPPVDAVREVARRAPAAHTHPYPVPADHDAIPHSPADHHLAAPAGAMAPDHAVEASPSTDADLPRFTIAVGGAGHVQGPTSGDPHRHESAGGDPAAPLPEASVTVPAKLIASAPASYPPDARVAQMEADVALEIVVDVGGHVAEARVTRTVGSGFDEAALRAIRAYRFTPASRDGCSVAVRMRWTVQFRLQ